MARKKLTLSVDESVIRRARNFSRRHGTSISSLVTQFLDSLSDTPNSDTAIVSRLRGILPDKASVEDYHQHLEKKYGR